MFTSIRILPLVLLAVFAQTSFAADHLQFVTTYLQPGTEHPSKNYLPEFLDHLSASHVGPEFFGTIRDSLHGRQAIIDLADEVFSFPTGKLLPDTEGKIDQLGKKYLDGHEKNILAFYIADEPTNYEITKKSLETVIRAVKKRFPGIPTYIVWDQDCFDNAPALDKKCGTVGQRGIPEGVDWVGFDWYLRETPDTDAEKFKHTIVATLDHLKAMTSASIVLLPDGTDEYLKKFSEEKRDQIMATRLKQIHDYALTEPRVIALDNYAWADHYEVMHDNVNTHVTGTRAYPATKKLLFEYADETRHANR
jgi:hypothetical protein